MMSIQVRRRASSSGISVTKVEAAIIKGMILRGDRQHDIAAWFGVNGGRVAEIATGTKFSFVEPASSNALPPPGPYPCRRFALNTANTLAAARNALASAERALRDSLQNET